MMPKVLPDSLYYIHTTHTIIDYIASLSERYLRDVRAVHVLDQSILADIRDGDFELAEMKLTNLVETALRSGASRIMVTCTSTGRLVDKLPAEYKEHICRIELPAIARMQELAVPTRIVYTNPTVWPELQEILRESGVSESLYTPSFVEGAFEKLLNGDRAEHDTLVGAHLERIDEDNQTLLLAQVSICSALERLKPFHLSSAVVSLAELGIISLQRKQE